MTRFSKSYLHRSGLLTNLQWDQILGLRLTAFPSIYKIISLAFKHKILHFLILVVIWWIKKCVLRHRNLKLKLVQTGLV